MNLPIAILTGASAGMGRKFFGKLQQRGDIDEIWIIARREDRLLEMARDASLKTRAIDLDLTKRGSISEFEKLLKSENPDVRILINNAGFGKLGYIYELDCETQMDMVELNNAALTALCTVCLSYMKKGAFIINVASIAAFAPNPRMAVYCSTKAYVLSFTKCIRQELKPLGINALAVCPGPMKTEFLDVAGISGGKSKTFETLPYCDPDKVAKNALKKAERGRSVYTPRLFFKFYRVLARILPHGFVMKFSKT